MTFYSLVYHVCFRRRTKHLVYCQVERTYAISLFECKTVIACCFSNNVHRRTFAVGNLLYMFDCFFINQQSHTFLRFVGNNFFCRQCFVADRKLVHVNQTTTIFY